MQEEFNNLLIEQQKMINTINAELNDQNQKAIGLESELQTTNSRLNEELTLLSAQQKTLQAIQYPGLGLALILAIIVFLVLNRSFRKKYSNLQADLSKFENQMESSFNKFQKEQQQAINKLQTSIRQSTEDFKAFTNKAEGHHKQMRQDFEALLSRHKQEEDEKLKNKIEPIDNRLIDIDKHFKKHESKLQELNKRFDSQEKPEK
jgi:predicted  nucleic acid-binding Zn-ribbon protein